METLLSGLIDYFSPFLQELCFLACLFYDDNAFVDEGKLTKLGGARWHEYIMSKDTTFLGAYQTIHLYHAN